MNLHETAQLLVARGKGILAADESNRSAGKRLGAIGVDSTEDTRRAYRELFLGAGGIEQYLTGVILYDETLRQNNSDGVPFVRVLADKGIMPGIKVDLGSVPFPGFPDEETTEGLDGLPERLREYAELGARFTKWREVIRIGESIPTPEAVHTHAVTLARYARMVQDAGMVPMLEPEVLLEGGHSMERAREVTTWVVSHMFYECARYRVDIGAVLLKTSMVVPGSQSGEVRSPEEVADATVRFLHEAVPREVPGVVFLSGGQEPDEATWNLNAIAKHDNPWPTTFSYARAIQQEALDSWRGDPQKVGEARERFLTRLDMVGKASIGELA